MNTKKYIILGLTPQGLAILREIGKAGADVTAFYNSKKNVGCHSKYGKKIFYDSIAELREYINEILSECDSRPICYITSGEILASVLREYTDLYNQCDVYSGPYPIVEMLAHKDRMYEYAEKKGFNVAKYRTLDKYSEGCLKYPIFLKRNYEIPLFFKAVKINTPEDLQSYKERIPEENLKDVIAQEFIDIPKKNLINISCQGFWTDGRCNGLFIANQKRKLSKGLTACVEEILDTLICTQMKDLTDNFMRDIEYNGFAEFEFMYDSKNNLLWFVEVNTRTCGEQSALHHKFSNISEVILHPDKFTELKPKTKCLHWMNIQRDIRARIESGDFQHPFDIFRSKFDILNWNDPKPFFRQFF